jgi:predicted glycosyltransferase
MDVSLRELIALRAKTIAAALEAFVPDVLVVDHLPRGALRELDPSLAELRVDGRTRCVLGLRDVVEDPARVRRDWRALANEDAVRDYYDAVWIYGDPAVYDQVREYDFAPEIAAKVHYTGYLDCRVRSAFGEATNAELLAALPEMPERLLLCMVGGGQDGANLAEAFAQAELPDGATGVILMGPFMPAEAEQRLRRYASGNPRLRVLGYVTDPDLLLACAERVVAMGGYNTTCEMLSFEKHVLIVPRSKPRHEQQIRAERLRALGLIDVLQPEDVNPKALAEWLARDLGPPPRVRERIDLNGTARLPHLLEEVLAAPAFPEWSQSENGEVHHATR